MAGPNFTMARGAVALTLVAIAAGVLGYNLHPRREARPAPPATNAPPPSAAAPLPISAPAALDRRAFLTAAARAASGFATGTPDPGADEIVGRQFEIRIPFGCFRPLASGFEDQAYWREDPSRHSMTVGVHAQVWTQAPWRNVLDPQRAAEAIEGFWIPRPWILEGKCPTGDAPAAASPQPTAPSVGLAMLYAKGGARTERRDSRPYEVTRPAPEAGAAPGPFALVLSGRVTGFADGAAFHCLPALPDQRPVCLAGVEIGRVRIETAAGGEVLGEWDG